MDIAQSRQPYSIDDDDDNSGGEYNAPKAMDTKTSPQQKHATTTEILSAYRKIALGIHPDKNDDKAANKCIQETNSAKAVLANSERRRIYDNFIKNTSLPSKVETFGDEDSEDDVEARCPMPGKRVLELHSEASQYIKTFFNSLEGPIQSFQLDQIDIINERIRGLNSTYTQAILNMHEVPREKLLSLQYLQRSVLVGYKTQIYDVARVHKEILSLQGYLTKTCKRGLYTWPIAWVQLIIGPLQRDLEQLGVSRKQRMPLGTDNSTTLPVINYDEDINMEDIDDDEVEGTHC
ncbi:hypothetical protein F5Y07DRAFT_398980 [Xylaria sp. FL0933]|nr:hypothetical protein F5Y07DRAFT_398980 [Xylaria sp. FL0933]